MNKTNLYYSFVKLSIQLIAALGTLVVAAVMSFPAKTLNPVFVGWLIVCGLDMLASCKEFSFPKPSRQNVMLYLLMALYLLAAISILWSDNTKEAGNLLAKRITFIVLPFYALVTRNRFINFRLIMLFFIASTLVSILSDAFLAWKAANGIFDVFRYHFIDQYHHRTYFSMIICTAFAFLIYLYHDLISIISKQLYFSLLIVISLLFFASIWLLEGRICLIAVVVIAVAALVTKLSRYRKVILPVALLLLVAGFLAVKNHPRMQNLQFTEAQMQQFDPRYELWLNAIDCIKQENKIIGVGVGDTEDVFVNNYATRALNQWYGQITTAHNQFLHTQLELGAMGLLLFVALLLSMFVAARGRDNKLLAFNLFVTWFLVSLTECNDIKYIPIYIFAFSLLLLYFAKTDERKSLGFKIDFSEVDKLFNA